MKKSLSERYLFRKLRVRTKIHGDSDRPRVSVYRSLKHIYAQIIDDVQGKTLAAATSNKKGAKASGIKAAQAVGQELAKKATAAGVKKVRFDRGGRAYHGRIKALAESLRQGGLEF